MPTLRLRCVDKRYSQPQNASFLGENLGEAYEFTAPGASLALQDNIFLNWLASQVKFLNSAGIQFDTVQLVDHFSPHGHGCAAYGNDDSETRHVQNLQAGAAKLKQLPVFSEAAFVLYLHDIDAGTIILGSAPLLRA